MFMLCIGLELVPIKRFLCRTGSCIMWPGSRAAPGECNLPLLLMSACGRATAGCGFEHQHPTTRSRPRKKTQNFHNGTEEVMWCLRGGLWLTDPPKIPTPPLTVIFLGNIFAQPRPVCNAAYVGWTSILSQYPHSHPIHLYVLWKRTGAPPMGESENWSKHPLNST